MIVNTNHRDIPAPARAGRQKQQKYTYIKAYNPMSANPAVFHVFIYVHFFPYQYNRYQREIQEENKKIRILEKSKHAASTIKIRNSTDFQP
jgi:hypothetical protein